jgi:hypothetical protein
MYRKHIPSLRTLAGVAIAVTAIACADRAAPTALADLRAGGATARDSARCDLVVSGRLLRFTGVDSTRDTIRPRLVPVPGGKVELYRIAPLPRDSVPRDTIPRDTIPRDTIPRDSVGGDSLGLRGLVLRGSRADTAGGPGRDTTRGPARQPDYQATTRGDGSFSIEGVCPGIYHIVYSEPGANGVSTTNVIVIRGDVRNITATLPPRRR